MINYRDLRAQLQRAQISNAYNRFSSKRNRSFGRPSYTRTNRKRTDNNGYVSTPYHVSAIPNSLYSTVAPQQMKVALKYSSIYTITTTAGLSGDQKFRLNSLFDSDYTSAGHQVRGHDQWAFIYEKYRVDTCKVEVIAGSTSTGGYISIVGNKSVASITDGSEPPESQNAITRPVQVGATTIVTKTFSIPALAGLLKRQYEGDDLNQALMGADPSNQWIGHVVFASSDLATSGVLNFMATITYYCSLFQPVQMGQS